MNNNTYSTVQTIEVSKIFLKDIDCFILQGHIKC